MLGATAHTDVATRFRSQEKEHQTSVPVTDEMETSGERLSLVWSALERFLGKDTKWKKTRTFAQLLRSALEEEWAQFGGEPETEAELRDLIAKVEKHGENAKIEKHGVDLAAPKRK